MKKILSAIIIASSLLLSCSNNKDTKSDELNLTNDTAAQNAILNGSEPNNQSTLTDSIQTVNSQSPAVSATTAAGMNPAHGQPGHRCDISVGAPLNSAPNPKPGTPASSEIIASPVITPSAPAITPSAPAIMPAAPVTTGSPVITAPGMNPPHGQPGHDCAIAVGAPLKK